MALPGLFESRVNDNLLFEQVLAQRATKRSGTASTKTRGKSVAVEQSPGAKRVPAVHAPVAHVLRYGVAVERPLGPSPVLMHTVFPARPARPLWPAR